MSMDHILPASAEVPDSQFLPGTTIQYAWDSVSLTNILACPRRYQYSIIDGYVSKAPGYAIALVFGILFHKGMEFYEIAKAAGATHDEATRRAVEQTAALPATATLPTDADLEDEASIHTPDAGDDAEDDGIQLRNSKIRTRYYLMRAIVWYLEHYRDDPAKTILMASGRPAVELSFRIPLELDGIEHPILLCGHIDRGVEFNGSLFAADYKTTKSLSRQFFSMFNLSHQLTGYTAAGQVIFERPVSGAIIDGIALQVGGVKLGRAVSRRSKGQIAEYFQTLTFANSLANTFATTGYYPMNTASCYFCDYKDVCQQPPEYRQRFLDMYFTKKRGWNPLENR